MSPGDLMKLLGRASGVELGGDSESPRYVVTLKFESKEDARRVWEEVCDLPAEEDEDETDPA